MAELHVGRDLPAPDRRVARARLGERARLGAPALAAPRELRVDRARAARTSAAGARGSGCARPRMRRSGSSSSRATSAATSRARSRGRARPPRSGPGSIRSTRTAPTSRWSSSLPDVAPNRRDALGAAYVALYTRLWDQDEAMMQRRSFLLDAPRAAPRRARAGRPRSRRGARSAPAAARRVRRPPRRRGALRGGAARLRRAVPARARPARRRSARRTAASCARGTARRSTCARAAAAARITACDLRARRVWRSPAGARVSCRRCTRSPDAPRRSGQAR